MYQDFLPIIIFTGLAVALIGLPLALQYILSPRKKYNWDNSNMIQFNSVKGVGLLFPSWLQHWVPNNKDDRISISWNIIARGDYGEPKSLQNANI